MVAVGFIPRVRWRKQIRRVATVEIKGGSSKWIKGEFPGLREFAWQDGYGAFTVSKSNGADVIGHVQNQREHHRTKSFKRNFWRSLSGMGLIMKSDIFGINSNVVPRRNSLMKFPWDKSHGYRQKSLRDSFKEKVGNSRIFYSNCRRRDEINFAHIPSVQPVSSIRIRASHS